MASFDDFDSSSSDSYCLTSLPLRVRESSQPVHRNFVLVRGGALRSELPGTAGDDPRPGNKFSTFKAVHGVVEQRLLTASALAHKTVGTLHT